MNLLQLPPLTDDEGPCAHCDLLHPSPGLFLEFWGSWIPLTSSWLHIHSGTLQVCAFLNYTQSIEFQTGGVHLKCRSISRMSRGTRTHPSSVLSFMAKAMNTYGFPSYLLLRNVIKKSKKKKTTYFFTLPLWDVICRILNKKMNLIYFGKRYKMEKGLRRAENTYWVHVITPTMQSKISFI